MWSCADPLAVSLGDPAGIGSEIALEAWRRRKKERLPAFFLVGNAAFLKRRARRLEGVRVETLQDLAHAATLFKTALPVWDTGGRLGTRLGKPDLAGAQEARRALHLATDFVLAGQASALITNPVHKAWLHKAGFRHKGQTEYFSARAKRPALMMLATETLRVALVTTHIPLGGVSKAITRSAILEKGRILAKALRQDFAIARPRIAVAALNPHGGEESLLGREEKTMIAPAIADLRREKILARGPFPADSLFSQKMRGDYDAALCMYHDQALIPVKMLGENDACVNLSLGLPFVRSSPDHGTAFEIAGKGLANPSSFMAALHLAKRVAKRRDARKGEA